MRRDFAALGRGPFDLLVVGGGIYGAWAAYDATLRGMRVALVERGDWGGGTSSASSKLIHGGLRYLEHGELGLVRRTLDERRRLARLAPHRVRPLRFLFPAYRGDRVGRLRLGAGLSFYDALAGAGQPVPRHRWLPREAVLEHIGLEPRGLRGAYAFGDCLTDDARLTLEIVDGAHRAGAVAVNRAAAVELLTLHGRVGGASVRDGEGGGTVEVRALATLLAAGAWNGRLLAGLRGVPPLSTRLTLGVHLVLPRLGVDDALVISSNDDARIVFAIPWYGRTLLGTTDTDHAGEPGVARVRPEDVSYLLERASRVLREPRLGAGDVLATFAGLRVLPASGDKQPSAASREWHLSEPRPGLYVSVGGKLTSARADAARIVERIVARAGWPRRPAPTLARPLPWCPPVPHVGWAQWEQDALSAGLAAGLDEETARAAAARHGARLERLLARVRARPDLARRLVPAAPFCRADVVQAAEDEMARSLEDVLRRRLPVMLVAPPSLGALEDAAALAGEVLGWDASRRRAEVDALAGARAAAR